MLVRAKADVCCRSRLGGRSYRYGRIRRRVRIRRCFLIAPVLTSIAPIRAGNADGRSWITNAGLGICCGSKHCRRYCEARRKRQPEQGKYASTRNEFRFHFTHIELPWRSICGIPKATSAVVSTRKRHQPVVRRSIRQPQPMLKPWPMLLSSRAICRQIKGFRSVLINWQRVRRAFAGSTYNA